MKAYSTIVDTSKKARSSNFCLMFHSQVDTRRDLILLCVLGPTCWTYTQKESWKGMVPWHVASLLVLFRLGKPVHMSCKRTKGIMGLHDNLWQCEVVDAGSRSCFSVLSGKSSKLRCLSLATPATSTSFGPPGQFLVVASRDSAVWTSLHTRFVTVWSFQLCERAGETMTFALKMKNSLLPGRARIEKEAIREALWLCLPPLIVYCPSSTIQIRNDWKPVAPPPTFHWTCFAHYEKSWRAHKPTISQNDRWCSNGLQSFRSNETICSKFCYFHITIYSLLRQINQ